MNVRLGRWSRLFAPGYSWCLHCGTPWLFVRERPVEYAPGRAQFALCVKCWDELKPIRRHIFHMLVCDLQVVNHETRRLVFQAVLRDSKGRESA